MDYPSPARRFAALSSVVAPAGRSAAGAFRRLGRQKLGAIRGAAARIGAAAAKAASDAASGAAAIFDTSCAPAAAINGPGTGPGTFESLEGRRMLSSVTLSNGVLSVVGNATGNNELVVQPQGSSNLYAYANNVNKSVPRSSVKSVRFVG